MKNNGIKQWMKLGSGVSGLVKTLNKAVSFFSFKRVFLLHSLFLSCALFAQPHPSVTFTDVSFTNGNNGFSYADEFKFQTRTLTCAVQNTNSPDDGEECVHSWIQARAYHVNDSSRPFWVSQKIEAPEVSSYSIPSIDVSFTVPFEGIEDELIELKIFWSERNDYWESCDEGDEYGCQGAGSYSNITAPIASYYIEHRHVPPPSSATAAISSQNINVADKTSSYTLTWGKNTSGGPVETFLIQEKIGTQGEWKTIGTHTTSGDSFTYKPAFSGDTANYRYSNNNNGDNGTLAITKDIGNSGQQFFYQVQARSAVGNSSPTSTNVTVNANSEPTISFRAPSDNQRILLPGDTQYIPISVGDILTFIPKEPEPVDLTVTVDVYDGDGIESVTFKLVDANGSTVRGPDTVAGTVNANGGYNTSGEFTHTWFNFTEACVNCKVIVTVKDGSGFTTDSYGQRVRVGKDPSSSLVFVNGAGQSLGTQLNVQENHTVRIKANVTAHDGTLNNIEYLNFPCAMDTSQGQPNGTRFNKTFSWEAKLNNPGCSSNTVRFYPQIKVNDSNGGSALTEALTLHVKPSEPPAAPNQLNAVEHTSRPNTLSGAAPEFNSTSSLFNVRWNSQGGDDYVLYWTKTPFGAEQPVFNEDAWQSIPRGGRLEHAFVARENVTYYFAVKACWRITRGAGSGNYCGNASEIVQVNVQSTDLVPVLSVDSPNNMGQYTLTMGSVSVAGQTYGLQQRRLTGGETPWESVNPNGRLTSHRYTLSSQRPGRYAYRFNVCEGNNCTAFSNEVIVEVFAPQPLSGQVEESNQTLSISGLWLPANSVVSIEALSDASIREEYRAGQQGVRHIVVNNTGEFEFTGLPLSDALFSAYRGVGVKVTVTAENGVSGSYPLLASQSQTFVEYSASASSVYYDALGTPKAIYVGAGNSLYALDPQTGEDLVGWPFTTYGNIVAKPVIDGVNGNVFVGSRDNTFYAINSSGFSVWRVLTGSDIVASALLDGDGNVYFGNMDGLLYKADTETGTLDWAYNATDAITSAPQLANSGQTILVTTNTGALHAIGRGVLSGQLYTWSDAFNRTLLGDGVDANGNPNEWQPDPAYINYFTQIGRLYYLLLKNYHINEAEADNPLDRTVMTFWTYVMSNRGNLDEVSQAFLSSNLDITRRLARLSHEEFLNALFAYALPNSNGDARQLTFTHGDNQNYNALLSGLNSGQFTRAHVASLFAQASNFAVFDRELEDAFDFFYPPENITFNFSCEVNEQDLTRRELYLLDCDQDQLPDYWELIYFGDIETQSGQDISPNSGESLVEVYSGRRDPCAQVCNREVSTESQEPASLPSLSSLGLSTDDLALSDQLQLTSGSFRVSESGAAMYNIAIAALPGTAGVAPQIALGYSSQSGNGLVGRGWSISGLSSISRCRQTLGQDNANYPINWTERDRYCLDGQRLVVVSGEYGALNAVYRTEVDSQVVVTSYGGDVGSPDYFVAEKKDGSLTFYGDLSSVNNSQLKTEDDHILTWAQSRFEDSVGNGVDYFYKTVGGHRIDRIDYAYGNSSTPAASTQFNYEGDRKDPIVGAVGGYTFETNHLLKSIEVINNEIGQTLRKYHLNYIPFSTSFNHINKLESIQEEGADGTLLKPLVFGWKNNYSNDFAFDRSYEVADSHERQSVSSQFMADINGDAYSDYVWVESRREDGKKTIGRQYISYVYGGKGGFNFDDKHHIRIRSNGWLSRRVQPIDINADGRSDIAFFERADGERGTHWKVLISEPQGDQWGLPEGVLDKRGEPTDSRAIIINVEDETTNFIDVNGDGLSDAVSLSGYRLLERNPNASDSDANYYRYGDEIPFIQPELEPWDGYIAELSEENGDYYSLEAQSTYIAPGGAGDFNGDGVMDFIVMHTAAVSGTNTFFGNVGQLTRFYAATVVDDKITVIAKLMEYMQGNSLDNDQEFRYQESDYRRHVTLEQSVQVVDFNGDGLSDALLKYDMPQDVPESLGAPDFDRNKQDLYTYRLNNGNGFDEETVIGVYHEDDSIQLADFNSDGKADLITVSEDESSPDIYLRRWLGRGFTESYYLGRSLTGDSVQHTLMDITADGRLDILARRSRISGGRNRTSLSVFHAEFDGEVMDVIDTVTNGFGATTKIHYGSLVDLKGEVSVPEKTNEYYQSLRDNLPYSAAIEEHTSKVDPHTLGKYRPVFDVISPMNVVVKVESSAPAVNDEDEVDIDAMSAVSYEYGTLRVQASGRGLLGFDSLTSIDEQTKVRTTTRYRQDFPFIGYPLSTLVEVPTDGGYKPISASTNVWKLRGWSESDNGHNRNVAANEGTAALGALHMYLAESVETNFDLEEAKQGGGAPLATVTTITGEPDEHGNAGLVTVTTVGNGESFTQVTRSEYDSKSLSFDNAHHTLSSYRQLGRLSRVEVRHERQTLTGNDTATRVSAFEYYDAGHEAGLMKAEIIEPDLSEFRVRTEYQYDDFGNKRATTVSGAEVAVSEVEGNSHLGDLSRSSTTTFDERGRYANQTTNALGQVTETVLSRNPFGQPSVVEDVNGVVSQTLFTPMGVPYLNYSSNGAYSVTLHRPIGADCPNGGALITQQWQAGGGQSFECLDTLGRSVRQASKRFNGRWSFVDTQYDALNRVLKTSEPFAPGTSDSDLLWSRVTYDEQGRVIRAEAPGIHEPILTRYDRFSVIETNPLGQQKRNENNAMGELVKITNGLGAGSDADTESTIEYHYDAQGNLEDTVTRSAAGESTVTIEYDLVGRKMYMNDPDKGEWRYTFNALGELREQMDAKGQKVIMAYDELGREVHRWDYINNAGSSELESHSQWVYNNAQKGSGRNGRGALEQVIQSDGYREAYFYDDLGRAVESHTFIPEVNNSDNTEVFKSFTAYDAIGRVWKTFDAASTEIADSEWEYTGVRNVYNNHGYLWQVVDAMELDRAAKRTFQTVQAMDLRGNATSILYENGLTSTRVYDDETGRLRALRTTTALGDEVQSLSYDWDDVGNLEYRHDHVQGLREDFEYDALNRIEEAALNNGTSQTLSYDAFGNIRSKSGVGTYQYGSECNANQNAGPHAVCATSDGVQYFYDANGNLIRETASGEWGGRTFAYTTFDKPNRITKGNHTVTFDYGPSRSRYRRVDSGNGETTTTLYLGNVERISYQGGDKHGTTEMKRYIGASLITLTVGGSEGYTQETAQVMLKDHLGSTDVITNMVGDISVAQRMSFDVWGQRRNVTDWDNFGFSELSNFDHSNTTKGFTGHEMLDEVGVVHMNGRIYDARLGRFLQADPHVDGATNTQGFNRYAYVHNNPLNATDPSGYFSFKGLYKAQMRMTGRWALHKYLANHSPGLASVIQVGLNFIPYFGQLASAHFSFDQSFFATRSFNQAFRSGAISYISSAAFNAVGEYFGAVDSTRTLWGAKGLFAQGVAHGVVGGVMAELQGGKFGHGFAAAGVGFAAGATAEVNNWSTGAQFAVSVIAGGTASEITGGKFANGAVTSAFGFIFNQLNHPAEPDAQKGADPDIGGYSPVPGTYLNENGEAVTVDLQVYGNGNEALVSADGTTAYQFDHRTGLLVNPLATGVAGEACVLACLAPIARGLQLLRGSTVTVTSWAGAGQTADLAAGRWVMVGGATRWNYARTFLWGPQSRGGQIIWRGYSRNPFSNSITGTVPRSSVGWPTGRNFFRGFFGQRQLK
ncbi:RHS repeat-associated core domain-containing protein [Marinibactrum halimedae]|uniref:Pyrrolo-quinoline quinone repeat domain-containing protein n=1 Tax=Marinibactrum halimedae TaxID=1444977 RepID=A0AA37T7N3_9GAMM|nr:RHS repeat-associated core domain-containing protein [Marinibactrum halimedae]MCD9458598.1 PQQ-binding-like beta-propeller repeat protein [Marinibactrum halimedae]GLS26533.1 hypothetical protein GCM10007877_22490 [Marinibactrum halimedae]